MGLDLEKYMLVYATAFFPIKVYERVAFFPIKYMRALRSIGVFFPIKVLGYGDKKYMQSILLWSTRLDALNFL